jgi:hypothetical protein
MTADTALGAALGAALVGICVGEWVRRRPALSPPSMVFLEMGVVLVTTALGAFLGGCVGTALSGETLTERPLHWEPVSPPRAGLVCWRAGDAVVCEPEEEP